MLIDRHEIKKMKKRKRRKRMTMLFLIPLLLFMSVGAVYGAFLYNKAENVFTDSFKGIAGRDKSELRDKAVDPTKDNVSILFIGIDESKSRNFGNSTRSDALMLATFNNKKKSVKLLSIPRDTYTYIPKLGYKTKINSAHAHGGPKPTIDAVENLLDVPVDYYVEMNFYAFMDVVDALNGITVDVPYEISEKNSEDKHNAIHLMPGKQKVKGEDALAFVRTRHQDSDIQRGERQQQAMKAIMDKATSFNAISKYDNIIEAVGKNMKTNMTFDEMKAFIKYGSSGTLDVKSLSLKGDDSYIEHVYYYQLQDDSLQKVKQELKDQLEVSSKDSKKNLMNNMDKKVAEEQ
jgi:LCP family protein required for cell wall assembly